MSDRADAKYCSAACRIAHWRRRARLREQPRPHAALRNLSQTPSRHAARGRALLLAPLPTGGVS